MKATIKDVARAAGVSVSTASMALNNRKGVNKNTQEQVLRAARELNYVPNYSARSLVTNNSNYIGLIVPEIVNPFYSAIVDIMTRLAEESGYSLLLGISNNKQRMEKEYIEMFLSRSVLGVVIVPRLTESLENGHLELLRSARVPFVFCTERYQSCTEPCVMTDFAQGEYDLIRHLLDRGMRRVSFLTVSQNALYATRRMEGYLQAHRERGIPVDDAYLFYAAQPAFQEAYDMTDALIQRNPDAIVTINDIMAIAVLKRLSELGVAVPQNVWVAGFDDMMFSGLAQKPITTVRQPLWEICGRCMEILEERIRNPAAPAHSGQIHLYPAELVLRSTTE